MDKYLLNSYKLYIKMHKKRIKLTKNEIIFLGLALLIMLLLAFHAISFALFGNTTLAFIVITTTVILFFMLIIFSSFVKNDSIDNSKENAVLFRTQCDEIYKWLKANSFTKKQELEYCFLKFQLLIEEKGKEKIEAKKDFHFLLGALIIPVALTCTNTVLKDTTIETAPDILALYCLYLILVILPVILFYLVWRMLYSMINELRSNELDQIREISDILNIIIRTKFKS